MKKKVLPDPRQRKGKIIERFDHGVYYEMERRIENFWRALKNPMKRLTTPEPDVKHNVHNVDTQGFQPTVRISVDEDSDERIIEEHPDIPYTRPPQT